MVVVTLMGGLGNQMFQYATARTLAQRLGTFVKFDLTFLNDDTAKENFTQRHYELDIFEVEGTEIGQDELADFRIPSDKSSWLSAIRHRKPSLYKVVESGLMYRPFTNRKLPMWIHGYWQSEKYFQSHRELLLKEFSINNISEKTIVLLETLREQEAVSVHIRRGDYVLNAHNSKVHGSCSIEYYEQGIAQILKEVKHPVFYFFSDDINWVIENFQNKDQKQAFIDWNVGERSYEDMFLMMNCKHNIVANSSFSWWGAWLNNNPRKKVIAPIRWFNDLTLQANSADIVPNTWTRI